jgi:hypothetical protein
VFCELVLNALIIQQQKCENVEFMMKFEYCSDMAQSVLIQMKELMVRLRDLLPDLYQKLNRST